jgi:hypothetical protein
MCSSKSGPILRKNDSASQSGVPCSGSEPPPRGRVAVKWEQLDEVELLLNQKDVAIVLLDVKAQELMMGAKEKYTAVEARGEASIKVINKQAIAIAHRE